MRRRLSAFVGIAALASATLVAAAPADATTWYTTPPTKTAAYSWNGYTAYVEPHRAAIPRNARLVSRTMTVTRGGKVVARNVKARWLTAGQYTVFTTTKFRVVTAETRTRTGVIESIDPDYCLVLDSGLDGLGGGWYDLACTGTGISPAWTDATGTFDVRALWGYNNLGNDNWFSSDDPGWSIGLKIDPLDALVFEGDGTGTYSYRVNVVGPVRAKYTKRAVVIAKVINTPVMTRTEWGCCMIP